MVYEETAFVEASGQEDRENDVIMSFVICAVQQKKGGRYYRQIREIEVGEVPKIVA